MDWNILSLVDADGVDAVLLMAGARSTFIAGQIALARPLPVLAIDHFDGAAGVIRSELATTVKDYPSSATHNVQELIAWLKDKCATRAKQREQILERERHYSSLISQKHKGFWATTAFIALLVIAFLGTATGARSRVLAFSHFRRTGRSRGHGRFSSFNNVGRRTKRPFHITFTRQRRGIRCWLSVSHPTICWSARCFGILGNLSRGN